MTKTTRTTKKADTPVNLVANIGAVVVVLGVFLQLCGLVVVFTTQGFDIILISPLALIVVGYVLIKVSGQKLKNTTSGILQNVIDMIMDSV